MSTDHVVVTRIESETEPHGLVVRMTIRRFPDNMRVATEAPPRAGDVPEDIRQALREWLG